MGELNRYLNQLSAFKKANFLKFSEKEKLAFLINAYNAFTVKLIVDNISVKSIKDLSSIFTSVWKKEFFTLLEEKTYLNHIEHDLIRKKFKEPRIHFALVCASISCPSLQNFAFTPTKLEHQLNDAAQMFLLNRNKNNYLLIKNI